MLREIYSSMYLANHWLTPSFLKPGQCLHSVVNDSYPSKQMRLEFYLNCTVHSELC